MPVDLIGVLDLNEGLGQALIARGGLFEFVFLLIWLIAKGFKPLPPARAFQPPALASASCQPYDPHPRGPGQKEDIMFTPPPMHRTDAERVQRFA